MWSDWFYKGLPELGDLVIAECFHEDTYEEKVCKGVVAEVTGTYVRFVGEPPINPEKEPWVVERWKKWLPSEFKGESHELELEVS